MTRWQPVLTFVVMPCLDEERYVGSAVASLLDSGNRTSRETRVVVVDNGSTDGTLDVLNELGRRYPNQLTVASEAERGYVPPRRTGVARAAALAEAGGVLPRDVLVLQADADTDYRPGYVAAMEAAAANAGEGVLLEGATRRPANFVQTHPAYVLAERATDRTLEALEVADEDDVVVDDKVCAYRLSDYLRWGGLFEEVDDVGDQIHAETMRMFIRARLLSGARKIRVNPAGAEPSRRKILEDPRYHFATMGFPRERSWAARTKARWQTVGVKEFADSVLSGGEPEAVRLRRAHLLALFRFLPSVITTLDGGMCSSRLERDVQAALALLPCRAVHECAQRPGRTIMDVLGLIDRHLELFERV